MVFRPAETVVTYKSTLGKPTALSLSKPRYFTLRRDLAQDGRVERRVRRLATGTGPESLRGHLGDQIFAVEINSQAPTGTDHFRRLAIVKLRQSCPGALKARRP